MTSLLAELEAATIPVIGERRCVFGKALDAFPDEADAILAKGAPGSGVGFRRTALARILRNHGFDLGETTIRRHIGGQCACYR